ncbi:unnamed protein product [Acidithrix sp. C25]|nr:unnamed protein product [Acidithrix sp. C25]
MDTKLILVADQLNGSLPSALARYDLTHEIPRMFDVKMPLADL